MKLSSKIAAVVLVGTASQVSALDMAGVSPYAGVDLSLHSIKGMNGQTFPKQVPGMNITGGLEVVPNVSVEASLHRASKSKDNASVKHKGLSAAVVGARCLNESLSLLGSLGVSHLHHKFSNDNLKLADKKLRPKLGVGLSYQITPSVSWRTMGSWTGNFGNKAVHYAPTLGISTGLVVKL